jgi:hypothetical protein
MPKCSAGKFYIDKEVSHCDFIRFVESLAAIPKICVWLENPLEADNA